MSYFLTLLGSLAAFFLIVFLRYLSIRLGFRDRNFTQVQRTLREQPPISQTEGFLSGSKPVKNEDEDTDRSRRPKTRKHLPFQSRADIKRSYIIDAILDKPKWREEARDREW